MVHYLLNTSTDCTEYKIIINNDEFGTTYEMYRVGPNWTDDAKEIACAVIEDHGNGVNVLEVSTEMDYTEFHEFYLLSKFVFSYDKSLAEKYIAL
jgi:hypothetical protein